MPWDVFVTFLRLGCTSFGGPVAHYGYFRTEFVERRRWLTEEAYGRIIALSQFLPGPASSQAGIVIGYMRSGALGGFLAWVGFTAPSAIIMVVVALAGARLNPASPWIHGLLVAAVAVVASAVLNMAVTLCPDWPRRILALVAALAMLMVPQSGFSQLLLIAGGGLCGLALRRSPHSYEEQLPVRGNIVAALASGALFVVLLVALPIAARLTPSGPLQVVAAFYQSGALVFGGGHVILPLLHAQVVPPGWVSEQSFIAGYGAAQAVPGPLFSFAAYLGAAMHGPTHGIGGAALALGAIYLPSFLLIAAVLPFWSALSENRRLASALSGVNAAVVGLLLAALYRPIWVSAIRAPQDIVVAALVFVMLQRFKVPPLVAVVSAVIATYALSLT